VSAERLRVAVLLDSLALPAWQHRIVGELATSESAELVLAVLGGAAARRRPRLRGAVFRTYEALDRRFFSFPQDHAAPVEVTPLLARCPTIDAVPRPRGRAYELPPAAVEAIRAERTDVILNLGFPTLAGEVLGAARLGVWSFDHEERAREGTPPLVWEMVRGLASSETCLRATTPEGSRVLQRSWASTDPSSLHRSRNGALWKSSRFVQRGLRDAFAGFS
jgi:hypothetical protein